MKHEPYERVVVTEKDIKTSDINSLVDIREFTERCIEEEKRRGDSIEGRIGILAALAGGLIGGVFALGILGHLPASGDLVGWLYTSSIVTALIFAFRCLYYTVRTVEGRGGYRLVPDRVIRDTLQGESRVQDMKTLIRWRLWELEKMLPLHTTRHYFVSCASWAIAASYMYIAFAGAMFLAAHIVQVLHLAEPGSGIADFVQWVKELHVLWIGIFWFASFLLFIFGNLLMRRSSVWKP